MEQDRQDRNSGVVLHHKFTVSKIIYADFKIANENVFKCSLHRDDI